MAGQTYLLKWVRLSQSSILTCCTLYSRCLQTARRGIGRRCLCQSANMHQPHNEQGICCQGRRTFFRAWSINVVWKYMLSFLLQLGISSHYICLMKMDKCSLSLLQEAMPAMSCPVMLAFFWTMCSLHSLPAACLFWVTSVFSFFPACRAWYC